MGALGILAALVVFVGGVQATMTAPRNDEATAAAKTPPTSIIDVRTDHQG